ncbi:Card1-like endonuclease domain-containing protein [Gynuella sp.]|uniref:Card1-like endonuclease domain-containing protein n=1 Tax=Gynuella sp. TaxID=2969146 RepID=UPI003D1122B5
MNTKTVQLVLVSEQPGQNLCPLMDLRLKPDEVILAATPNTPFQEHQQWLMEACKPMGIQCTLLDLPQAWQTEALRQTFESLVTQRLALGHKLVLNSTGGYRPVAIIAHEVFFYRDLPVFFLNKDWVRWLSNPDQQADFALQDNVKLPAFMLAHGLKVESICRSHIPTEQRELAQKWQRQASAYSQAIAKLNYYASQAEGHLQCNIPRHELRGDHMFLDILDQLSATGLADLQQQQLTFASEEARFFANGGWLEERVFSELFQLRSEFPRLQDVARSVQVRWLGSKQKSSLRNEFDVLALYDNRLIVIECKTALMDYRNAQHVVYKLGSMLKHLGGFRTTGMITSFHDIHPKHHQRAKLFDVQICDRRTIRQLRNQLIERLRSHEYSVF